MNSSLNDLLIVLEWLAVSKTPTIQVEAALERLRKQAKEQVPIDHSFTYLRE